MQIKKPVQPMNKPYVVNNSYIYKNDLLDSGTIFRISLLFIFKFKRNCLSDTVCICLFAELDVDLEQESRGIQNVMVASVSLDAGLGTL